MYFNRIVTTMSLRDELLDIDGVGEATADKILSVVEGHKSGSENVQEALDYLEAGHPGYAKKFLEREL